MIFYNENSLTMTMWDLLNFVVILVIWFISIITGHKCFTIFILVYYLRQYNYIIGTNGTAPNAYFDYEVRIFIFNWLIKPLPSFS